MFAPFCSLEVKYVYFPLHLIYTSVTGCHSLGDRQPKSVGSNEYNETLHGKDNLPAVQRFLEVKLSL